MLDKKKAVRNIECMNRLPIAKRAQIIQMLVEGSSLRATSRLADVSINTVTKLLVDVADDAYQYHDVVVRDVCCRRVQADEIWCLVGAKSKNAASRQKADGGGDVWTWTAIDADTKLCVGYLVGGRDASWANEFMQDVASRIRGRVQLTTDGHRAYLEAVENNFGSEVDYAQLQKIYGASDESEKRYSLAKCIGCDIKTVSGEPDPKHVSTSFVERQNLTMRMSLRRFTRLTNAFSKKIENHAAAVALHFIHYNFARIHKTLRITPAMAAGISDHVWSYEEIAGLTDVAALLKS
jgi:IS1 family transposase